MAVRRYRPINYPSGGAHVHEGTVIDSTGVTDGYVLTADGAGNSAWEAAPGGGSSAWGGITGTLSNQTDLQSALDLKAPLASPTFTGTVRINSAGNFYIYDSDNNAGMRMYHTGTVATIKSHLSTPTLSLTGWTTVQIDGGTTLSAGTITGSGNVTGANLNISNWDAAWGWGDHSTQSYLTAVVASNVNAEASTDGWVLTSDGAGNAAWEVLPAGGGEINDLTAAVTWANIPIANVPTGTSGSTVAFGNHTHTGVYEPADGTILKDADIGSTVQAYDATYVVDADIGVSVAAFAHNHSGVYEPVDSTILRNGDPQEYIVIQDTKAGSNEDNWVIENEIGPFKISTATDAAPSTPSTNVITLNRVGTSPTGITLNDAVTITGSCSVTGAVTGSNLNVTNWDTAFGWGDWSGHNHSGVYEPADATIVKDADIGVTVQGYDVDTLFADVADTITALHQYSSNPRRLSQGGMLHHNSSSYTDGGVTFSTSAASGGVTGDVWFQYTA